MMALLLGHTSPARATEAQDAATAIALFPTQNRAGDAAGTAALDQALRFELSRFGRLVASGTTRDAVRRFRLRQGDRATPALLQRLGNEVGAHWLVSATLHEARRDGVPRLSVSARIYESQTGEMIWAAFDGSSGVDGRSVLGLGSVRELEQLAGIAALEILPKADLDRASSPKPIDRSGGLAGLGPVAIVPLAGFTTRRATASAEAVTEALRADLFARGVRLVSPNRAHDALRRAQGSHWGSVTAEAREALRTLTGASTILTGIVEAYDLGGLATAPDPLVTVALRAIDTATGKILWIDARERHGHDGAGVFALRHIHSRGALAQRVVNELVRRLDKASIDTNLKEQRR